MRFRLFLAVVGVLAIAVVAGWLTVGLPGSTDSATAQQATLSIVGAPASVSSGAPSFDVEFRVQDVTDLALYELWIRYDPDVIELTEPPEDAIENGPFLGSTGRTPQCFVTLPPEGPPPVGPHLEPGDVRFGCITSLSTPPGPDGSGLLSTVSFRPVDGGSVDIRFVCAELGNPNGDDIPISNVSHCVPPLVATPTATITFESPTPTSSAGTPAPTATSAAPTATPVPQGPTPTPEPTPPPESAETVSLFSGCNPVVSTYRDGTTVQTLANAIAPPESLESMWRFVSGVWSAYSPAFPQASNLRSADFLDVVFLCEAAPGSFVRPLV